MSAERTIDPLIKQHFDTINDQVVVDAIESKMGRVHKNGEQIYTHDTFMSEGSLMAVIAEACASAHEPGLSHHEVWQRAQGIIIDMTLAYSEALTNIPAGKEYRDSLKIATTAAGVAFAMHAIDRSMSVDSQNNEQSQIIDLWDDDSPETKSLGEIRKAAQLELSREGVVVRVGNSNDFISVSDVIDELDVTVENIEYAHLMKQVKLLSLLDLDSFDDSRLEKLRIPMFRLRVSKHITKDQLYAYLEAVKESSRPGDLSTAELVFGLPRDYIRSLWADKEHGGQIIDDFIAEAAETVQNSGRALSLASGFITALRDYFPGGLTGKDALEYAEMQIIRTSYANNTGMHTQTPPDLGILYAPKQIQEYNRISSNMVVDACYEMFPNDPDFADELAVKMLRSLSPRAYRTGQRQFNPDTLCESVDFFSDHVTQFGADAIKKLSSVFDISALDVLKPRQVETLVGLTTGEPTVIKALKEQDTSLIFFDAHGDHNGFITDSINQLATSDPNIGQIVIPLRHINDIENTLALLKLHDVKFCTLMLLHHGIKGVSLFNKGSEAFTVVADSLKNTQHPNADLVDNFHTIPSRQLPLKRIVRDDMCLPKFADKTSMPKQKRIIHISCYSDVGDSEHKSIAESSLNAIGREAVVLGVANIATVNPNHTDGTGLYIYGPQRGKIKTGNNADRNSNVIILKGRSKVQWIRIDGKLKKHRAITPRRVKHDGRIIV